MTAAANAQSPAAPRDNRLAFRHFPHLDGLRAVSITLVLLGHLWPERVRTLAGLGVLVFFVLSGFLITGLLCKERDATGTVSLRGFYVRRALRILPAAVTFLATASALHAAGLLPEATPTEVVLCLFYLRNIFGRGETLAHLWSLSLEEQFYSTWPLLFRSRARTASSLLRIGLVAALAVAAARSVSIAFHWFDYNLGIVYMRPWFRFDSILAGCCIALGLTASEHSATSVRRVAVRAWPSLLIPALLAWTVWGEYVPVVGAPLYLAVQTALCTALVAHLVVAPDTLLARVLAHPALQWLGRLSYSLYLWQQIFLVTRTPSWGVLREFPYSVGCALGLAVASYYLVERPLLKLKSRFAVVETARPT